MTPEVQLSAVVAQLRAMGVDPIAVWADGPNAQLRIFVKLLTPADLAKVAELDNGWRLSLPRKVAGDD